MHFFMSASPLAALMQVVMSALHLPSVHILVISSTPFDMSFLASSGSFAVSASAAFIAAAVAPAQSAPPAAPPPFLQPAKAATESATTINVFFIIG